MYAASGWRASSTRTNSSPVASSVIVRTVVASHGGRGKLKRHVSRAAPDDLTHVARCVCVCCCVCTSTRVMSVTQCASKRTRAHSTAPSASSDGSHCVQRGRRESRCVGAEHSSCAATTQAESPAAAMIPGGHLTSAPARSASSSRPKTPWREKRPPPNARRP